MNTRLIRFVLTVLALSSFVLFTQTLHHVSAETTSKLRFEVSLPVSAKQSFDGRLLLLLSTSNDREPRFQINEDLNTQQVFGVDVDGWKVGQSINIDENAFGYPRQSLAKVPPGEYWVQAL